jgi:ABC-type nitrate/sulfonate/bicarbonate transport system substrate-binding protein
MRMPRLLLIPVVAIALTVPMNANAQQTKVTIGKVIGGDGFHLPSYVALDKGLFKAEGLDASLIEWHDRLRYFY